MKYVLGALLLFPQFLHTSVARADLGNVEAVEVPQSELSMASSDDLKPRVNGVSSAQIGISSWSPRDFLPTGAGVGVGSSFSSLSAPTISGTYFHRLATQVLVSGGQVSVLGGLELAVMSREGSTTLDGASVSSSQTLYLLPIRIGAEYAITGRLLTPHLSAAVLQTVAFLPRSGINDGATEAGLGYEFDAGLAAPAKFVTTGATIGLDFRMSGGNLDSGSLYGLGAEVDLRFPI